MNPDRRILELEIRLLILKYGRENVLAAVAAKRGEQSVEGIEHNVVAAEEDRKPVKRHEPRKKTAAIAEVKAPPEIQRLLSSLLDGYRRRLFLPRLHDVERFLDHAGVAHGHLKSRIKALPKVTKVLSQLPKTQLERLDREAGIQGESDFAVLADEIVGGRRRTGRYDPDVSAQQAPRP